jgi:hypothetical protein
LAVMCPPASEISLLYKLPLLKRVARRRLGHRKTPGDPTSAIGCELGLSTPAVLTRFFRARQFPVHRASSA